MEWYIGCRCGWIPMHPLERPIRRLQAIVMPQTLKDRWLQDSQCSHRLPSSFWKDLRGKYRTCLSIPCIFMMREEGYRLIEIQEMINNLTLRHVLGDTFSHLHTHDAHYYWYSYIKETGIINTELLHANGRVSIVLLPEYDQRGTHK